VVLTFACLLPRADPRDAWLARDGLGPEALPEGAVLGTASPRRAAQILARRPDLTATLFRGNVDTRLAKLRRGEADATLLAAAGLGRLGRLAEATRILEPEELLPAAGQGAIGVQIRQPDGDLARALAAIGCRRTEAAVGAERACLAALGGSCRSPIAALAEIDAAGSLHLRAGAYSADGRQSVTGERRGPMAAGEALGTELGGALGARLPEGFWDAPA